MKYLIYLCLLYTCISQAQQGVGIGTTDPTKTLDVNGELRIRNLPSTSNNAQMLTADALGNVLLLDYNFFSIADLDSQVATTNVDFNVSGSNTVDNVDLGLSTTVVIPVNVEAVVFINYSVPMGINNANTPRGYYGIRFLRNGIEATQASRKFSINTSINTVHMITISSVFAETFAPSSVERTITYTLNGYVEQNTSPTTIYRYNMWTNIEENPNFNWGRATLTKTVYVK